MKTEESPIAVDERLLSMLARAYAASDETPNLDVANAALDLARSALDRGATDRAVLLLEAMEGWPLADGSRERERYERLRGEAGLTPP